ncbi:MAG: hypothetical protein IKQ31_00020 [Clostridia bacterium]|nr:hypothetical protein [Clostridia bacterium]
MEENKYYSFKITKIIAMRDGYLIRATTKVNKKKVSVVIVSPSESNKQCIKNLNALQLKKKYFLSLQRYFHVPACHIGMEVGYIVDILLGNHTISINESGCYWYIFTTMDLDGLTVRNAQETVSLSDMYNKDSVSIRTLVDSFVQHICFSKTMCEMTDTNRMKATFLRYGGKLWGRSPEELIEGHYNKRKWYIDSIPPTLNWTIHPYYIDTCNIEAMFQHTLDEYCCLPISDTMMNKDIKTDKIKLLYFDPIQNVYTVEIEWSFPSLDKTYILVVNVAKIKGEFKICGLNKPYCGYAMNCKHNGRMIQRKMNETTIIIF